MRRLCGLGVLCVMACGSRSGVGDPGHPGPAPEHDGRFVGLWIVEQPTHAAYEATLYDLQADGTLVEGPSVPSDCTGHLSEHCVTGSVARCPPGSDAVDCAGAPSCVFGDTWYSLDAATLILAGECSDGRPRDIQLAFDPDAESNATWAGAGATLVSVGGESGWVHDNWDWSFRKCTGPDLDSCCTVFDAGLGEYCRAAR